MAMVKCPDCEKEISTNALTCPNCGRAMKKSKAQKAKGEGCFLKTLNVGCLIFFIIAVISAAIIASIIYMV